MTQIPSTSSPFKAASTVHVIMPQWQEEPPQNLLRSLCPCVACLVSLVVGSGARSAAEAAVQAAAATDMMLVVQLLRLAAAASNYTLMSSDRVQTSERLTTRYYSGVVKEGRPSLHLVDGRI